MASSSSSSKIHLFKKTAIEDGTPRDYYLDPSDNLMMITSAWSVVEHEDYLALSISLLSIGDLVLVAPEKDVIGIAVIKENKEKAARFHHKDGMKIFSIKMNPKFLKYVKDEDSYKGLPDATVKLFIRKLMLNNEVPAVRISDSAKIHLFKKSAIKAGTPEDYYLDPSDNLMKIKSAWRVVEHEDYLVLTVDLFAIGDFVFFGPEPELNEIQIAVALENKEKAARFKHRDGMMNFSIKMNPKFIKKIDNKDDTTYKVLPEDPSKLTKVMIYKLKQ